MCSPVARFGLILPKNRFFTTHNPFKTSIFPKIAELIATAKGGRFNQNGRISWTYLVHHASPNDYQGLFYKQLNLSPSQKSPSKEKLLKEWEQMRQTRNFDAMVEQMTLCQNPAFKTDPDRIADYTLACLYSRYSSPRNLLFHLNELLKELPHFAKAHYAQGVIYSVAGQVAKSLAQQSATFSKNKEATFCRDDLKLFTLTFNDEWMNMDKHRLCSSLAIGSLKQAYTLEPKPKYAASLLCQLVEVHDEKTAARYALDLINQKIEPKEFEDFKGLTIAQIITKQKTLSCFKELLESCLFQETAIELVETLKFLEEHGYQSKPLTDGIKQLTALSYSLPKTSLAPLPRG